MPSVLKPNLIFLASFANVGNVLSTFLHCDPSAGCLNILSCLRSFLCHRINLAFILFMNKHFRRGIRGKYHITLAGTLFLTRIPSTSPGSSRGILYRHALHTGHESKFSYSPRYRMQSLGQACIFCASNPKGQTTFFASYVVSGKVLPSGSKFFISFSNSSNPLSDKPFVAFHCNNYNVVPNFLCTCLQYGYNKCSVVL